MSRPFALLTTDGQVVAAATQYDLSAGAGAMAGLVQPSIPRPLNLTITDGDAGVSAIQIDVVGTDLDDAAATEQFLFAGGLTQSGTQYFKTITSITITSVTGEGAGDKVDFDWAANVNGPAFVLPGGGSAGYFASGTWDTATVTLQVSHDGVTWHAYASGTTLAANGWALLDLPAGVYVRAALSSVGGSTSVSAVLI